MMDTRPHVVLLRSAREDDPYERALREAGFTAACEPVLSFSFVRQDELRRHVQRVDRFGGLVCTSPRAVEALRLAMASVPGVAEAWVQRPAFAVGPRTAEVLRQLGLAAEGEEAGDATELADYIIAQAPGRPLLFLSGNRRRDALPGALSRASVPFVELTVYETQVRTDLELRGSVADWLVFFSPSGLEAVERAGGAPWDVLRLAAIGPTTAGALREAGRRVDAVAEAPEPAALVRALLDASPGL